MIFIYITHHDTHYDFWYACVKWWYFQEMFSFFKILIFGGFTGIKGKKGLKLSISVCFALYLRNCRSYHQDLMIMISTGVFLFFKKKKCNIVNMKIICFLLAHFNSFFNYLFIKFINKCQKEFLRCALPSSHVCDFFVLHFHVMPYFAKLYKYP